MKTAEEWFAQHHKTKLASGNPPLLDLIRAIQEDALASGITAGWDAAAEAAALMCENEDQERLAGDIRAMPVSKATP